MKRLSLLAASVIVLLAGPGLHGQSASGPVRADTMHLTVVTSVSETAISPGQRVSLAFEVTPKKRMHVYAPGKHDYQVIAVKLDPQPWFRVQPTTYPPSEIYHFEVLDEKVETYGKPFKLVQDVTILSTPEAQKLLAASPSITLSGRLEYQACDDRVCYAPTRVPVSFTLAVK